MDLSKWPDWKSFSNSGGVDEVGEKQENNKSLNGYSIPL